MEIGQFIVKTPGTCGGRARLAARRIPVSSVYRWFLSEYGPEDILEKYVEETPLLWKGFKMVDKIKGNLGAIEEIMQIGVQWLAQLTYRDKEILVPLVPQTINQVNLKTKTIYVDLPVGLIEVYLD